VEYTNKVVDEWVAYRDGLDSPEILVGANFPHFSRPSLGPTQPPVTQWVAGRSRGQSSRGVALTIHSLIALSIKKVYRYNCTPPCAFMASSRVEFLVYIG
jgi:hypothetical protein